MTQLAERFETYTAAFEAFRREPAFGGDPVGRAREAAFDRFLAQGFPTTRDEEWRFTNVSPIAAVPFERPAPGRPSAADVDRWAAGAIGLPVVVVNGRLVSVPAALPAGVTVRSAAEAPADVLVPRRASGGTIFTDLNTALFEDVVWIDVAPKAVVTEPIEVVFVTVPGGTPVVVSPRLVVTAGEQAQATIIESYLDAAGEVALANAATDVRLGPGAIVEHAKFQAQSDASFHVGTMFVRCERASTFASRSLVLGGRIARNDIVATLDGEGAEATLNGLYVGTGDALVDTHTTIDHAQPHCPSHEVYKGILSGRSRAVFNGKILVRQDAQKTDAKQTNKALLLTDEAQVNTKPQLEIFADDVKCTHGAAIGQLDEDAMFYLKARGIAAVDARNLLIHAFAGEVIDGIGSEALRARATARVEQLLGLPA